MCECICALYRQATGVDHPADEEHGPCGFVADQVEEGPIHSVGEVPWCRGDGGVLVPLGRHLHDHLVTYAVELSWLSGKLLQVCVRQPIRETCRGRGGEYRKGKRKRCGKKMTGTVYLGLS